MKCFAVAMVLMSAGCVGLVSGGSGDAGPRDGGRRDGGGTGDAGPYDAGPFDAGARDAGVEPGPVCGDGVVDPGERCDGDCPTSCPAMTCQTRRLDGDAASCTARCVDAAIEMCVGGDGCCPAGCTLSSDSDCTFDCNDFDGWPADWAAEEMRALEEMNRNRIAGSDCPSGPKPPVEPLVMNRELRIAARCHSMDMATNDFFSHSGSDGSSFSSRAGAARYTGRPRAENIAAGNGTGVAAVGQWMASTAGHCDANMNGSYNEIGLGYARRSGTMWTHYWTAVFGSR